MLDDKLTHLSDWRINAQALQMARSVNTDDPF